MHFWLQIYDCGFFWKIAVTLDLNPQSIVCASLIGSISRGSCLSSRQRLRRAFFMLAIFIRSECRPESDCLLRWSRLQPNIIRSAGRHSAWRSVQSHSVSLFSLRSSIFEKKFHSGELETCNAGCVLTFGSPSWLFRSFSCTAVFGWADRWQRCSWFSTRL